MIIIGIDYHPSFQQIALMDRETGECGERELNHSDGEAEKFYRELKQRGISVRVGMEATGYSRWFERLLAELGFEVWIGDAAEIKTKRVRKQKTDREDARLMLKLLVENRFPRIWVPSPENRDLRQLLWHRHRLVQMRTRIMNQLQAVAMNEGYGWKKKLFSEKGRAQLEKLSLAPWAQSAPERIIGAAGPAGSKDCGVNGGGRARSQETARGTAVDDASWRGTHHGTGLRSGHITSRRESSLRSVGHPLEAVTDSR
jgi:transposase